MGNKKVCLKCRISFSINSDSENSKHATCPNCKEQMTIVHHKFKPPKRDDLKNWKLVELLVKNGFLFQSVYVKIGVGISLKVNYPKNLIEAKDFVEKYRNCI